MFENPSAGKFGPPSENARREQEHQRVGRPSTRRKDILVIALALVGLGLQLAPRTRGWIAGSLILLSAIVLVVEHLVLIRIRDERGGPEPYSPPPRITR